MLLLGIFLLFTQCRKYYLDEFLKYSWQQLTLEIVITGVAVLMILRPLALIEVIQTIVKHKYGKTSDE